MASPGFAVKLWFALEQAGHSWVPVTVHAVTSSLGECLQPFSLSHNL